MKKYRFIAGLIGFALVLSFTGCEKLGQFDPNPDSHATFTAKDGVIIVGKYVPPKSQDKLTFIMLHGLASVKGEWDGFGKKINQLGYGYFAYDLRGHGESNKDIKGNEVNLNRFASPGPGSEWERMVADLARAVKYLVTEKGIKRNTIAIAGASLGANIAFIYASKHKPVPLVILMSPGMEYAGLKIDEAMKHYSGRPIAIAASPGDAYAFETSAAIYQVARKHKCKATFFTGQGAQHGVQIFAGNFDNQIIDWINNLTEFK